MTSIQYPIAPVLAFASTNSETGYLVAILLVRKASFSFNKTVFMGIPQTAVGTFVGPDKVNDFGGLYGSYVCDSMDGINEIWTVGSTSNVIADPFIATTYQTFTCYLGVYDATSQTYAYGQAPNNNFVLGKYAPASVSSSTYNLFTKFHCPAPDVQMTLNTLYATYSRICFPIAVSYVAPESTVRSNLCVLFVSSSDNNKAVNVNSLAPSTDPGNTSSLVTLSTNKATFVMNTSINVDAQSNNVQIWLGTVVNPNAFSSAPNNGPPTAYTLEYIENVSETPPKSIVTNVSQGIFALASPPP